MITLSPGTFSLRILRISCIFVEISASFQLMTLIAAGRFSCGLLSRGMCDTFCLGMVGSVELIILLAEWRILILYILELFTLKLYSQENFFLSKLYSKGQICVVDNIVFIVNNKIWVVDDIVFIVNDKICVVDDIVFIVNDKICVVDDIVFIVNYNCLLLKQNYFFCG